MKFNANEIIARNSGDVHKTQLAWKYAAYQSASGKPTSRLLAMALQHDTATLSRLCAQRGI
jgi:hypothetical protein